MALLKSMFRKRGKFTSHVVLEKKHSRNLVESIRARGGLGYVIHEMLKCSLGFPSGRVKTLRQKLQLTAANIAHNTQARFMTSLKYQWLQALFGCLC